MPQAPITVPTAGPHNVPHQDRSNEDQELTCVHRFLKRTPYWIFPLLAGFFWFAMLWAMMITWLAQGQPVYTSMTGHQTIAYISDIGADMLKPLFVTGGAFTGFFFFLTLLSMRPNHLLTMKREKVFDLLAVISGFVGGVCLILLAVFDTKRHTSLHRLFLFLFMLGVVFSAIFTTLLHRLLRKTFTWKKILKVSYWFKVAIVILEVSLSVAFGVTMYRRLNNIAAVIEWLIAFLFTFYVISFFFDLRSSSRTKDEILEQEMVEHRQDNNSRTDLSPGHALDRTSESS